MINTMEESKEKKTDLVNHQNETEPIDCIDLSELETKSKEELLSIMMRMEMSMEEYYSGPLPHPRILKGYEEIVPGAAERILTMAENQASHRQDIEKIAINSNVKDSRLGVIFAFIIGMTGTIGGIYAIVQGAVVSGTFITGASLASIVTSFIYGTRSERAERKEKSKEMKSIDD